MTGKVLGRKFTITIVLIVAAIACLLIPERPFRLGLDLQGGTRLVYEFDFDAAMRQGKISPEEYADKSRLLEEFCNILRDRVDPNQVMELSVRPEGQNRIVIELPGAAELASTKVQGKLALPLSNTDAVLELDAVDVEAIKAFPLAGGLVSIDGETIGYGSRHGAKLQELRRGQNETPTGAHASAATVLLLSNDDLQKRIENVGDLQFLINADSRSLMGLGTDETKERQKLDTWLGAHPGGGYEEFNRLPPDQGGPTAGLRWYPRRVPKDQLDVVPPEQRLVLLTMPPPEWIFSGNDLELVGPDRDTYGYPAVRFEMAPDKKDAFGGFTEKHIDEQMSIVLNGEIVTDPRIESKLPGSGIITGGASGFTQKEVTDLVTVLRSGSLRIKPELLAKNRVGASLGENYVTKSFLSAGVALGIIIAFMVGFYRKLGAFAVVALLVNLLLLMGALAFLQATLTLPGVAGIILTLSMAVDGNILIFERLREETAKGLKLVHAAKVSFERAGVAIIDSNLTTLMAGLILQNVGTGPIKGFAVTLNIGIVTTLFCVIVVSEMLILWDIQRGTKSFSMAPTLKSPNLPFMRMAKYGLAASALVILAGNALFVALPDQKKLGIDFLGGFRLTANTQEPRQVGEIQELVRQIPGTIGESVQVRQISDSGTREKGYTQFLVECKLSAAEEDDTNRAADTGEQQITAALASVLQKDPIQVTVEATQAKGELDFEDAPPAADVTAALVKAGVKDPIVEPSPERANVMRFQGATAEGSTAESLAGAIRLHLTGTDSAGRPFNLRSAIPESTIVGPQIGAELRDRAIIALLLSLVATILYLRVRFAEYSYGFGTALATAHDVLVVLGALAIATMTGIVQAELDLAMIAAFLTIIGYSQNDKIVLFDRVRENLRHAKEPLVEVLNTSINQTLTRTYMTGLTVLSSLVVLLLFNLGSRNVLEAFSFAMFVGLVAGVYSTIYVASPVLLWFERRAAARNGAKASEAQAA